MIGQWLALILDESKWFAVALAAAVLTVTVMLHRHRHSSSAPKARTLSATTLLFGVTISVMAFGHLLAVTIKLLNGSLLGSAPAFYAIGIVLAVPAWWLLVHTIREFGHEQGRTTLVLNGSLALTLLVLGLPNLPLALPGFLNVAYQINRHRGVGWAIAIATVVLTAALFTGSVIFWASGQTFEQFSGME